MTSPAKRSTARPVGHLTQLLPRLRVLRPTAPWEQDSPRGTVSQPPLPEDAHWNAERQAVELGVEIGEDRWIDQR
jgi:hypothetical protein